LPEIRARGGDLRQELIPALGEETETGETELETGTGEEAFVIQDQSIPGIFQVTPCAPECDVRPQHRKLEDPEFHAQGPTTEITSAT